MKAELQNYLVKEYPEFFEYLKEYKGPLMPISFGFECGDGWFVLLDELMGEIQNHVKNVNRNRDHELKWKIGKRLQRFNFRHGYRYKRLGKLATWAFMRMPRGVPHMRFPNITQVKEKFGGLRFYIDGGDDEIYGMIGLAESLSYRTCEFCGTTKDVGQTQGWIITCCKACVDSDEKLQRYVWKPQVLNIYKEAQKHMNELLDKAEEEKK